MDGSIIIASLRQYAPQLVHPGICTLSVLSQFFKYYRPLDRSWTYPFSPSKLLLHVWGSGSPSNEWLLGPTRVNNPNDNTNGLAAFAGLTVYSRDRPNNNKHRTEQLYRNATVWHFTTIPYHHSLKSIWYIRHKWQMLLSFLSVMVHMQVRRMLPANKMLGSVDNIRQKATCFTSLASWPCVQVPEPLPLTPCTLVQSHSSYWPNRPNFPLAASTLLQHQFAHSSAAN